MRSKSTRSAGSCAPGQTSAAEVCPGAQLPALKTDFDRINGVLAGMLAKVQDDVEELSPWSKFLDKISDDKVEDAVINWSLTKARDCAWRVATRLAASSPEQSAAYLARLDHDVSFLGRLVRRPAGVLLKLGLLVIRLRESNDVPHTIDVLSQT